MARHSSHAAERKDRMQWSKDAAVAVWGDRLSRVCAIVAGVSLWLTVTLTEPAFLAPLLGAAFGVWFLRGHRALLREVVGDDDDWF
jgi:Co/Zn/Cd efflux system component